MSKMGISTLQSYHGAQIFEAIGLSPDLIDRYFTGTASRIGGIDLDVIAEECRMRHERGLPEAHAADDACSSSAAQYHYRAQGERHLWNPRTDRASCSSAVRHEDVEELRGVLASSSTSRRQRPDHACAACGSWLQQSSPSRSTRSSRRAKSSSASRPAP